MEEKKIFEFIQIEKNLYFANGDWIKFLNTPYPLRCYLKLLKNGNIFFFSPVQPHENLVNFINNLTKKNPDKKLILVSSNLLHFLFLFEWKEKFPNAIIIGNSDLQEKLDKKKIKIKLDLTYEKKQEINTLLNNEIIFTEIKGSYIMKETIFYLKENKSIIITDLIQRHDTNLQNYGKISKFLLNLAGVSGNHGACPRDYKSTFYWPFGKRDLAKECFKEVLEWEFDRVFLAHGKCVMENGKEYVRNALGFLI